MTTEYDVHMQEAVNTTIKLKEDPKKLSKEALSRLHSFIMTKYPEVYGFIGMAEFERDTMKYGKGVFSFASHYTRTKGNLITIVATYEQKDKKHADICIKAYEGYLHDSMTEEGLYE